MIGPRCASVTASRPARRHDTGSGWCARALAIACIPFISCGPDALPPPLCSFPVPVRVTLGIEPRFEWDACEMTALYIALSASSMVIVWHIDTPTGGVLRSGVIFGRVPAGAVELTPPSSLVRGQSYDLFVMHGQDSRQVIGGAVFTY